MVNVDLWEVEDFFFEASRKTYAGGSIPKTTIADLPGSKVYRYLRGDFLYVDCYFSSGRKSFGQTVVCFCGKPVWWMQYHGAWESTDERVIPFLKKALAAAYSAGLFIGGRGPRVFEEEHLVYVNNPTASQFGFADFQGREEIRGEMLPDQHGRRSLLFWHEYRGGAL